MYIKINKEDRIYYTQNYLCVKASFEEKKKPTITQ